MKVKDEVFSPGKIVFEALSKSTSVALFIGTCGDAVETLAKQYMKDGHTLEGYITDIIGSEIAEGVAEYVHQKMANEASIENLKTTNRYSPGYCNWHVKEQNILFHLMGENNAGVRLTSSSLMIPIKSVSGIVGIGEHIVNRGYSCAICDTTYCLYRDKK